MCMMLITSHQAGHVVPVIALCTALHQYDQLNMEWSKCTVTASLVRQFSYQSVITVMTTQQDSAPTSNSRNTPPLHVCTD